MEFLPLFASIKESACLVVGGGAIATRKAALLARAGGRIRMVAPEVCASARDVVEQSGGEIRLKEFEEGDLDGVALVVAATDNVQLNAIVSDAAKRQRLLVNVVDQPALCTFVFPSIIDRDPVMVAISSSGASPVLARLLRARIETLVPASYGRLANLAGRYRKRVAELFPDVNQRRGFWESILSGPVAEMVFAGKERQAESALSQALDARQDARQQGSTPMGEVYLVGAGPGDPELLTFRALRLMQQADVVLYDRLVSPEVLDLVRRDAERIHVGKERDNHTLPQSGINQLLVDLARQGRRVCRLKGGDPFIFGRGGEEIETLADQGVPFQVVPGITAASGCASYAGIPLTHRDYSQSVRFITGHLKDGTINLDWPKLAGDHQTLVFYMGLVGLPVICERLQAHGMSADTPVALVQQGTTRHQRVVIGTLATISAMVAERQIKAPTLTIIGEVVNLHERLQWFQPSLGDGAD
ncbi:Uroporphyrin-III methylase, involved in siroheme cofactor synthesis for assimilatory nitrite reductase [gamma proteobacterium HdN1]|nr:Uroporphyrin-III methylase, involved in siroheme cofactor synthesis for assimilatory nitrite reductase [gamma proteobacterium HdN1]